VKYRKVLSRRTLLRGAGTVMIGLPFLDAMRTHSVYAATPDPPARAFNVFFGLGFPTPLQDEGWDGPLAGLSRVRDRLMIVRGVDQTRCDEGGINAHFDGAAGAFTAERPDGETRAGGPSIDQVLRRAAYPEGQPEGIVPTLHMGTYFRRSRASRYVHSYNADGTPTTLPQETPRALFERVFGSAPMMEEPSDGRRARYRRSVLDSVLGQYRHYQSDASGLGRASRARIADHLDRVREHELRVFADPDDPPTCAIPDSVAPSPLPHGDAADPDGSGIDITVEELTGEWRLMADLFALAVQCDRVRFGAATFQAAGERIRLTGSYRHEGALVYDFDDRAERGVGGSQGCSHEWWHAFREANANPQLRAHVTLLLAEVGYLLERLDDPAHADENGLTILQNALVTVSTESGDGRHSDVNRELSGVFHAFSGSNERLRAGEIVDVDAEGLDVYNTVLAAHDVETRLGPADRAGSSVGALLR